MTKKTCKICKLTVIDNKTIYLKDADNWWYILNCWHEWQEPEQQKISLADLHQKEQLKPIVKTEDHPIYEAYKKAALLKQKEPKMPIKFIQEENTVENELTFGVVEENQFFVSKNRLLQKVDNTNANIITNNIGSPFAMQLNLEPTEKIDRILPHIKKIEF